MHISNAHCLLHDVGMWMLGESASLMDLGNTVQLNLEILPCPSCVMQSHPVIFSPKSNAVNNVQSCYSLLHFTE